MVDIVTRQEHPGPGVPPHTTFAQKRRDAERHKHENAVAHTVLVDDVDGTVHRRYGGLADPAYLIGSDGRVAFYNYWTHVPTLHRALTRLEAMGGRGVVGEHRVPHLLAAIVGGWPGLERGLPQSVIDLETALPGTALGPWLGYQLRGVLAPVALRATPWPPAARAGAALFTAGLAIGAAAWLGRTRRSSRPAHRRLRPAGAWQRRSGARALDLSSQGRVDVQ